MSWTTRVILDTDNVMNTRCFTFVVQYAYALLMSSTPMSDCDNTMLISTSILPSCNSKWTYGSTLVYVWIEWSSKVTNTKRYRFVCFYKGPWYAPEQRLHRQVLRSSTFWWQRVQTEELLARNYKDFLVWFSDQSQTQHQEKKIS